MSLSVSSLSSGARQQPFIPFEGALRAMRHRLCRRPALSDAKGWMGLLRSARWLVPPLGSVAAERGSFDRSCDEKPGMEGDWQHRTRPAATAGLPCEPYAIIKQAP